MLCMTIARDRDIQSLRAPSLTPPAVGAGLIALLGFGAQTALWLTGGWHAGRHGFPDYRSGTIGDAILVPVMVGILIAALRNESLAPATRERRVALAAGLVGMLAGAGVQLSWLLDSNPVPNWTLPKPHHFTLPGWYHACFLTVTSGAMAALAITATRRLRVAKPETRRGALAGPWLGVLLGAGIAFVALVALDSSDSSRTTAGLGTIIAASAATAAGVAACGSAMRWDPKHLSRAVVLALCVAATVVVVALIVNPLG